MITQSFKNGKSEIRFENAESMEDAKKNGFTDGVYTRFFIDNKPVQNYMALMQYIVDETRKTGKRFIPPTHEDLKNLQKKVIQTQNNEMRTQIQNLKNQYIQMNAPEHVLKQLDEAIDKIDLVGMRVVQ
jgi:hypothetical protein